MLYLLQAVCPFLPEGATQAPQEGPTVVSEEEEALTLPKSSQSSHVAAFSPVGSI